MNIALIGYGKMGKAIEQIALNRGHNISLKISSSNKNELTEANLKSADVVIEFTRPDLAPDHIEICANAGKNIICGTTGWLSNLAKIQEIIFKSKIGFIQASNFSLGVNIFFAINEKLALMMNQQPQYDAEILEIHHTAKLDSPSGTAISIAEDIIKNSDRYKTWGNNIPKKDNELAIISERKDPAPGTHIVSYTSPIDTIEISHTAHSREGFALGAIIAAEWLQNKKGIYSMKDVLNLYI
ncbi:MAG: 4-hydroxy-tetrahydrodipicolinate reductase [Bacteroidota bacterium]|jgi:4-hydroxy-tetrahydrodipicolinate reductase